MFKILPIFLIILCWPLAKLLISKLELKGNRRAKEVYKKGIFVWIGSEHYRPMFIFIIIALYFAILQLVKYQSVEWAFVCSIFLVNILLILLHLGKITLVTLFIQIVLLIWVGGSGKFMPTFPFFHDWPTAKEGLDLGWELIFTIFTLLFNIGVFEKPKDLLNSPQLTALEREKIAEHIREKQNEEDIN